VTPARRAIGRGHDLRGDNAQAVTTEDQIVAPPRSTSTLPTSGTSSRWSLPLATRSLARARSLSCDWSTLSRCRARSCKGRGGGAEVPRPQAVASGSGAEASGPCAVPAASRMRNGCRAAVACASSGLRAIRGREHLLQSRETLTRELVKAMQPAEVARVTAANPNLNCFRSIDALAARATAPGWLQDTRRL
jgi:hypothetical protein